MIMHFLRPLQVYACLAGGVTYILLFFLSLTGSSFSPGPVTTAFAMAQPPNEDKKKSLGFQAGF